MFHEYMRPSTKDPKFVIHQKEPTNNTLVSDRNLDIPQTREIPVTDMPERAPAPKTQKKSPLFQKNLPKSEELFNKNNTEPRL